MQTFYDPSKTYEENVAQGPFLNELEPYRNEGEPEYSFLGHRLYSPFGIAAGILPTSKHTNAAFQLGYDVSVYKTQRSREFPCNPFPNILPLDITGDLTVARMKEPIVSKEDFPNDVEQLTITNSFGVPSPDASVWTDDLPDAISGAGKGQLLIMSVVGTIQDPSDPDSYYDDFAQAATLAKNAGAKAIEVNLSCPNVASEGVICYSEEAVFEICKRTKQAIGNTPLIIKVGYYDRDQQGVLEAIIENVSPYISAISAINTLPATIVNSQGDQALPGKGRARSGVCGASIRWAGLDLVGRLDQLRKQKNYNYEIVGVGGVMTPKDFHSYRQAGADIVQAATTPIWNPNLAIEIKDTL